MTTNTNQAVMERLLSALNSALGIGGEFPFRKEGDPAYWWRPWLQAAAGLEYDGQRYVPIAALSACPSDGGEGGWAPTYGLLEDGEALRPDDEYYNGSEYCWKPVPQWSGQGLIYDASKLAPTRRRTPSPAPLDSAQGEAVYLVPSGETKNGQELYERYDGSPPPLCDFEKLYTHPAPQQAGGGPTK